MNSKLLALISSYILECHVSSSHAFAQVFARDFFEKISNANLNSKSNKIQMPLKFPNATQFKQNA